MFFCQLFDFVALIEMTYQDDNSLVSGVSKGGGIEGWRIENVLNCHGEV